MAYQLMIKSGRAYVPIKIRNHKDFIIDSSLLQEHIATLREIDLFTSQYSESDFRRTLVTSGLISLDNFGDQLAIRYTIKGKMETLADSIIFSDEKDYLDEKNLENALFEFSNNDGFIRELLKRYLPREDAVYYTRKYVNLDNLKIIESVLNGNYNFDYIKSYLALHRKILYVDYVLCNLQNRDVRAILKALVLSFYYDEIYERKLVIEDYNPNRGDFGDYYVYNQDKKKYRRFHDLIKFVSGYSRVLREEEEYESQEEFLEPGELTFNDDCVYQGKFVKGKKTPVVDTPKVKKRVKKKKGYIDEGQTSFF